jgi:hypothetical protein
MEAVNSFGTTIVPFVVFSSRNRRMRSLATQEALSQLQVFGYYLDYYRIIYSTSWRFLGEILEVRQVPGIIFLFNVRRF